MAQIRVTFDSPQKFDAITVTEMTVEADQLVLLAGGSPVLNVAAGAVRSLTAGSGDRLGRLREKHPNHGKSWTAQEDQELARLWDENVSPADLSGHFGRSRGAVRSAVLRLRLPDRTAPGDG